MSISGVYTRRVLGHNISAIWLHGQARWHPAEIAAVLGLDALAPEIEPLAELDRCAVEAWLERPSPVLMTEADIRSALETLVLPVGSALSLLATIAEQAQALERIHGTGVAFVAASELVWNLYHRLEVREVPDEILEDVAATAQALADVAPAGAPALATPGKVPPTPTEQLSLTMAAEYLEQHPSACQREVNSYLTTNGFQRLVRDAIRSIVSEIDQALRRPPYSPDERVLEAMVAYLVDQADAPAYLVMQHARAVGLHPRFRLVKTARPLAREQIRMRRLAQVQAERVPPVSAESDRGPVSVDGARLTEAQLVRIGSDGEPPWRPISVGYMPAPFDLNVPEPAYERPEPTAMPGPPEAGA